MTRSNILHHPVEPPKPYDAMYNPAVVKLPGWKRYGDEKECLGK